MVVESQIENYTNRSNLTTPDELLKAYKLMLISRRLDEKMLTMLKQGKGFFHIGAAGHEAAQLAAAFNLKKQRGLGVCVLQGSGFRARSRNDT